MNVKSRWEEYKEKNGVTPLDIFVSNTPQASEGIVNKRLEVCQSCPDFVKLTTQCKKCKCIMKLKTKLDHAKCPVGKW
jgi:hypothetical protein